MSGENNSFLNTPAPSLMVNILAPVVSKVPTRLKRAINIQESKECGKTTGKPPLTTENLERWFRPSDFAFLKINNFPGLHHHARLGRYYACKRLGGIHRECSLDTCDRQIAERRVKEWLGSLDKRDVKMMSPARYA